MVSVVGTKVGAALAGASLSLRGKRAPVDCDWVVVEPVVSRGAAEVVLRLSGRSQALGSRSRPIPNSAEQRPIGLRVRAATVMRLANSGQRPVGIPVAATPDRPGGILLSNVSGLGIGLRDGDVLVKVAGAPVGDVGSVVERVVGARAAKATLVEGVVWRDRAFFPIAVEQPYLNRPGMDESTVGQDAGAPDAGGG